MKRALLSILLCLSAIFCASGTDSLRLKAALLERERFYAQDPVAAEAAFQSKTALLQEDASGDSLSIKPVLAFLPPLGHIKMGEPGRGLAFTALDLGFVIFGVTQIFSGCPLTGYLVGAVGLDIFWFDESLRLLSR